VSGSSYPEPADRAGCPQKAEGNEQYWFASWVGIRLELLESGLPALTFSIEEVFPMRLYVRTSAPLARRSAVTLTELTVVIAIISVLSGLSFFAFTSAKRFADKIDGDVRVAHGKVARSAKKTGATPVPLPTPAVSELVPGEYYVGLNPAAGNANAVAQRLAGLVGGQVVGVYTHGTYGCGIRCPDANINRLNGDDAVRLVQQARRGQLCGSAPLNIRRVFSNGISGKERERPQPNRMFGAPPSVYRVYRNTNIRSIVTGREYLGGTTTAQIVVACIDSGIDSTHPDLHVVYAQDFSGGNDPTDALGHGTHVAGVVGAVDRTDRGGVVGVYPGAPLMNLKITSGSSATNLSAYAALDFVIANAATIPVCLMAFTFTSDPIMDAMVTQAANQGVIIVAAAGFTAGGTGQDLDTMPLSPASSPGAITVGNLIDGDGLPGGFLGAPDDTYGSIAGVQSPYGSAVAFVAPGGAPFIGGYAIQSTIPLAGQALNGLSTPYSNSFNGGPILAWGTSFSAAHVAGMMAMLKDPQTNIGFILGAGRAVTTYHLQMNNRAQAIAALRNATHHTTPFQMVNPRTGSAWEIIGFPRHVAPYMKSLYGDYVTDPAGRQVPVANFYVNPGMAPSFLAPFPG
jgi:subtilisin family serine protease